MSSPRCHAARESTPRPQCGCPPFPDEGPRVASSAIAIVTLLLGPLEVRDDTAPVKLGARKARARTGWAAALRAGS